MFKLFSIVLFLAISQFSFADNAIWKQGQSFISLVPSAQSNNHPISISAAKLVNLLQAVQYQNNDDERAQVFSSPKKLKLFAKHLSKALAKANSRQDLNFLLMTKRTNTGFFAKLFANGGRIFYQGGKLNIIFSELLSDFEPRIIYGKVQSHRAWKEASIQVASTLNKKLLSTSNVDKKRGDWLAIDPNFFGETAEVQQPQTQTRDYARPAPLPKMGLEQRLKKLKDLKQKGLISDEQYDDKVRQILDAL